MRLLQIVNIFIEVIFLHYVAIIRCRQGRNICLLKYKDSYLCSSKYEEKFEILHHITFGPIAIETKLGYFLSAQ